MNRHRKTGAGGQFQSLHSLSVNQQNLLAAVPRWKLVYITPAALSKSPNHGTARGLKIKKWVVDTSNPSKSRVIRTKTMVHKPATTSITDPEVAPDAERPPPCDQTTEMREKQEDDGEDVEDDDEEEVHVGMDLDDHELEAALEQVAKAEKVENFSKQDMDEGMDIDTAMNTEGADSNARPTATNTTPAPGATTGNSDSEIP